MNLIDHLIVFYESTIDDGTEGEAVDQGPLIDPPGSLHHPQVTGSPGQGRRVVVVRGAHHERVFQDRFRVAADCFT